LSPTRTGAESEANHPRAIAIWLKGEAYELLVVEVEEPETVVVRINEAVGTSFPR
jgi:hypothetical protein